MMSSRKIFRDDANFLSDDARDALGIILEGGAAKGRLGDALDVVIYRHAMTLDDSHFRFQVKVRPSWSLRE